MCGVWMTKAGVAWSADPVAASLAQSNVVVAPMLQVLDNGWSDVVHRVRCGAVQSREQHRVCRVYPGAVCSLHWHDCVLAVSDWTVRIVHWSKRLLDL